MVQSRLRSPRIRLVRLLQRSTQGRVHRVQRVHRARVSGDEPQTGRLQPLDVAATGAAAGTDVAAMCLAGVPTLG